MGASQASPVFEKVAASGVFIALTALSIYWADERRRKVGALIRGGTRTRRIQMLCIFLAAAAAFVLGRDSDDPLVKRLRDATLSGFMAFIIALFAHLDLIIAPFWLVWTLSFFYGKTDL